MRKEARKRKKLDKTGWGIVTVVIVLALLSVRGIWRRFNQ